MQAKYRSDSKPGRDAIDEVYAAHWSYDTSVMVVATNTFFSPDAIESANRIKSLGFEIWRWDQSFFLQQTDNLAEYSKNKKKAS